MKPGLPKKIRLNKYIADSGVTSRRKADRLIETRSVQVNGKTVEEPGVQVLETDVVTVNGTRIRPEREKVCVMFNKPPNVVTTMNDPEGRPSVGEYFAKAKIRLFPIGRLDWASEGLLLLTNDGELSQKISHPTNKVTKTYLVKVDGEPTDEHLQKLVRGFSILGGRASALSARRMQDRGSDKYAWVQVIIDEGRNHQVRLMFAKLGFDVKKLQRTAIGSLKLSTLEKGKFKILEDEDLAKIFIQPKELRFPVNATRLTKKRSEKQAEKLKKRRDSEGRVLNARDSAKRRAYKQRNERS